MWRHTALALRGQTGPACASEQPQSSRGSASHSTRTITFSESHFKLKGAA